MRKRYTVRKLIKNIVKRRRNVRLKIIDFTKII